MNTTSRLVEVGVHISRERFGATGKAGTVQDLLDLNRQHMENGSDQD